MSGIDLGFLRTQNGIPRLHVEEGATTFGKKNANGVPRLYIEVRDETGAVVFSTWQNGPLSGWQRATLYFGRSTQDASGEEIGFSLWD